MGILVLGRGWLVFSSMMSLVIEMALSAYLPESGKGLGLGGKGEVWAMLSVFRELMFLCSGSVPPRRGGDEKTGVQAEKGGSLPGGGVISAVP